HCLLTGTTEAVQRETGRGVRPACGENREPSDARAVIADAVAVADDDVFDDCGIRPRTRGQRVQALREQFLWVQVVQRAVRLTLPARRADTLDDPGFPCCGHGSITPQSHRACDGVSLDLAGAARDRGDDRFPVTEAHDALGGEAMAGEDLHAETGRRDVPVRAL